MCCLFIPDDSMFVVLDKNKLGRLVAQREGHAAACIEDFNSLASAYFCFTGASACEVPITSTGPYVNFVCLNCVCLGGA